MPPLPMMINVCICRWTISDNGNRHQQRISGEDLLNPLLGEYGGFEVCISWVPNCTYEHCQSAFEGWWYTIEISGTG